MLADQTGGWRSLGAIKPKDDWTPLSFGATTPFSSFRLIWTPNRPIAEALKQRQYFHIRQLIYSGSGYLEVGKWQRVYPSETQSLIQLPYPPDIARLPLPQRQLEVKLNRRVRVGFSIYSLWTIEVYEKISSPVDYPFEVELPAITTPDGVIQETP